MKPALFQRAVLAALILLPGCTTLPVHHRQAQACLVSLARAPRPLGEGVVVNLLTDQAAKALLARTEANLGAPIDPAYLNNQRANVRLEDGRRATVLLPLGMAASPGDRIAYQGAYRSPGPGCSYVPNLATRKL
ncbi:MAG: hypothetical protein JWM33_1960 [Caulobacteraceae bacterium]|nr:hypothetical protein [Caulobacteraceae bacterium]